jgi:hypothetical protein
MAKKELNLLQLLTIYMAQLGARPTEIVWCEMVQLHPLSVPSEHVPDNVLRDSFAPRRSMPADWLRPRWFAGAAVRDVPHFIFGVAR